MPYINKEDRTWIPDHAIDLLSRKIRDVPSGKRKGALNYVVSRLALQVFGTTGYGEISEAIAALNDAAAEIRRRVLDPYEDQAIAKSGDLPELETSRSQKSDGKVRE